MNYINNDFYPGSNYYSNGRAHRGRLFDPCYRDRCGCDRCGCGFRSQPYYPSYYPPYYPPYGITSLYDDDRRNDACNCNSRRNHNHSHVRFREFEQDIDHDSDFERANRDHFSSHHHDYYPYY